MITKSSQVEYLIPETQGSGPRTHESRLRTQDPLQRVSDHAA